MQPTLLSLTKMTRICKNATSQDEPWSREWMSGVVVKDSGAERRKECTNK